MATPLITVKKIKKMVEQEVEVKDTAMLNTGDFVSFNYFEDRRIFMVAGRGSQYTLECLTNGRGNVWTQPKSSLLKLAEELSGSGYSDVTVLTPQEAVAELAKFYKVPLAPKDEVRVFAGQSSSSSKFTKERCYWKVTPAGVLFSRSGTGEYFFGPVGHSIEQLEKAAATKGEGPGGWYNVHEITGPHRDNVLNKHNKP
jgi:hypothetical protein